MMLRAFLIASAGVIPLTMSGCSAPNPPPITAAPSPPAAQAAAAGSAESLPGTQEVSTPVPPTMAPVGPIPGARVAGDDPATTTPNPYANDPSALEQGRQLFVAMNCAGCHGGHAGGGMGPDLRPDHIFVYGNAPANIFDSISMGRAEGMPSWGTKLPPEVIWKLVAYIQSLGTEQEPDKAAPAPAHAPDAIASPSY